MGAPASPRPRACQRSEATGADPRPPAGDRAEQARRPRSDVCAFLDEVDSRRLALAGWLLRSRPEITEEQLDLATQSAVCRELFAMILEQRGVDARGLLAELRLGEEALAGAPAWSTRAGRVPRLQVEILGQVHEHCRGRPMLLSARGAQVVARRQGRRTLGVYYTPPHVTRFLARVTLAPLMERTGGDVPDLRLLDPACGAGWFLLASYRFLLEWHCQRAPAGDREPAPLGRDAGGRRRLPLEERRRILATCIYGLDLDPRAVEVTRLSLLLELVAGEHRLAAGVPEAHAGGADRLLPELTPNIQCGNAIIGSDYAASSRAESELARVRPFDWRAGFAAVFDRSPPGFDVVVGNPPYLKEYTCRQPFLDLQGTRLARYYQGKMDLWQLFACQALDLLRPGGRHAFIVPSSWTASAGASKLRAKLLDEARLERFVDFGAARVFASAGIHTAAYVVEKRGGGGSGSARVRYARLLDADTAESQLAADLDDDRLEPPRWACFTAGAPHGGGPFSFVQDAVARVLARLEQGPARHLQPAEVAQGIVLPQERVTAAQLWRLPPGAARVGDGIFLLTPAEARRVCQSPAERALLRPYYTTEQLGRFRALGEHRLWLLYTTREVEQGRDYASVRAHLDRFQPVITSSNAPYGLHRPRDPRLFAGPRIFVRRKTGRPCFTYVDFPGCVTQTFNIIKPQAGGHDLLLLTGLLNSRLSHFWLWHRGKRQGAQLQIDVQPLLRFPIREPRGAAQAEAARVVAAAVARVAVPSMRREQAAACEGWERRLGLEQQIDHAVYALYELTPAEIEVVERETPPLATASMR